MRFSLILIIALGVYGSDGENAPKKYSTLVPDSLIEIAAQHIVDRVGNVFYQDNIDFWAARTWPQGSKSPHKIETIWRLRIAGIAGANTSFSFKINLDGTLSNEVPLPPCGLDPTACYVVVDSAYAIDIAESTFARRFEENSARASFQFGNYEQLKCFRWQVIGGLVSNDDWAYAGSMYINATDRSVIRIDECKYRDYLQQDVK